MAKKFIPNINNEGKVGSKIFGKLVPALIQSTELFIGSIGWIGHVSKINNLTKIYPKIKFWLQKIKIST